MNKKGLSKFFLSYEHVFSNYFSRTKRLGAGHAMVNSLAAIYANYYPELDLSVYKSTQMSLRLLFGLNSLDCASRSEASGITAFLNKTYDSWYLKYGHHDLSPLRVSVADAAFSFSRNGLFHRLLFDEYRIQFRKTWSPNQDLGSPDVINTTLFESQYDTLREKNPYLFLNTKRATEFSIFESKFSDRFYKTHELLFKNQACAMQQGATLETYLAGRQRHEKLCVTNLNLDVRFKQSFQKRTIVEATRRGFYFFCFTFNRLALINYSELSNQNQNWSRHLLRRLIIIPFGVFEKMKTPYLWVSVIINMFNFLETSNVLDWRTLYKLINLRQNFCYFSAKFCTVLAIKPILRLTSSDGLIDFIRVSEFFTVKRDLNITASFWLFWSRYLKLGWRTLKFKLVFNALKYLFFNEIRAIPYSLGEIAVSERRCFLAESSNLLSQIFFGTCSFGFLSNIVNQFMSLLMLAEFRLNNLYAFRIFTQLAVGYPGLYLPDNKYGQIFANNKFFFTRIFLQKSNIAGLRRNLRFRRLRVTASLFVIEREALVFIELVTHNFIKRCWGLQSVINTLFNKTHLLSCEPFPVIQLLRLMFVANSNACFKQSMRFITNVNQVFEATPDSRVLLNMNWVLSKGTLQQFGWREFFYSARFLRFNLRNYHEILSAKIDELYFRLNSVYVAFGAFTFEKDAVAFQLNDFFRQFDRLTAISATPNLSAALQLNYGRSGILNIFRSVGVADYSQFFNLYAQNEVASFSLARHALLLDAGVGRIKGNSDYLFFDALSKAFFVSELRDLRANSAVDLAIAPFESPLFFSEHLKLGGFLNLFDCWLPLNVKCAPLIPNTFNLNVRGFVFLGSHGLLCKDKGFNQSYRIRSSRVSRSLSVECNLITRAICSELLKI